jgi:hypothetical protein
MNFIERLLGLSPDGGNGGLELVLVVGIGAAMLMAVARRSARGAAPSVRRR